jgi:Ribosomal protein S15
MTTATRTTTRTATTRRVSTAEDGTRALWRAPGRAGCAPTAGITDPADEPPPLSQARDLADYARNEPDTGSTEVQVALPTVRINDLADHRTRAGSPAERRVELRNAAAFEAEARPPLTRSRCRVGRGASERPHRAAPRRTRERRRCCGLSTEGGSPNSAAGFRSRDGAWSATPARGRPVREGFGKLVRSLGQAEAAT